MKTFVLFSKRGMSIVQVLLTLSITSVVTGAVATILIDIQKSQSVLELRMATLDIRQSIIGALVNDGAWKKTLEANAMMKCRTPNQKFCNQQNRETVSINLVNARGEEIFNSRNPTKGFTIKGVPCNTYSATGNSFCALRPNITWRGVCQQAPCSQVLDFITIEFTYNPGQSHRPLPFNPANFNLIEQLRTDLGGMTSPQVICAKNQKIYIGVGNSFNGESADGQGCVDYIAFVGAKGEKGAAGANGADGANAVCP